MRGVARAGLVAAALAAACGDGGAEGGPSGGAPPPRACTQIGCGSSVVVELDELRARGPVRVCAAGRCVPVARGESHARIPVEPPRGDRTVRVTLHRDGRAPQHTTVRLTAHRPNGPDCPPVCWGATAVYDADRGRLVAA